MRTEKNRGGKRSRKNANQRPRIPGQESKQPATPSLSHSHGAQSLGEPGSQAVLAGGEAGGRLAWRAKALRGPPTEYDIT